MPAISSVFEASIADAFASIDATSSPEEAYKAFMEKLGEGFTKTLGDAIGAAIGVLDSNFATADADRQAKIDLIVALLRQGTSADLDFPSPGLLVPITRKVSSHQGSISDPGGAALRPTLIGGSVGVTGTVSF